MTTTHASFTFESSSMLWQLSLKSIGYMSMKSVQFRALNAFSAERMLVSQDVSGETNHYNFFNSLAISSTEHRSSMTHDMRLWCFQAFVSRACFSCYFQGFHDIGQNGKKLLFCNTIVFYVTEGFSRETWNRSGNNSFTGNATYKCVIGCDDGGSFEVAWTAAWI